MKKQDFDEMKAFCNEKGFELLNVDHEDNEKFYVIAVKKDPWKGVEFYQTSGGRIKKMDEDALFFIRANCGAIAYPSTEQAYVDQKQEECFKRFGFEIDTEKIDDSNMSGGRIVFDKNNDSPFLYRKDTDTLYACGVPLYQQGKWATKLPERVKVELLKMDCDKYNDRATKHTLKFLISEEMVISKEVGKFLAEQLEKYINNEIKSN